MGNQTIEQLQQDLRHLKTQLEQTGQQRSEVKNFAQLLMGLQEGVISCFLTLGGYRKETPEEGNDNAETAKAEFLLNFAESLTGTGRRLSKEAGRAQEFHPLWDIYESAYRRRVPIQKKLLTIAKQKAKELGRAAIENLSFVDLLPPNEVVTLHKGDEEYAEALFIISIHPFFSQQVVPELPDAKKDEISIELNSLAADCTKDIENFKVIESEASGLTSPESTPAVHRKLAVSEEHLFALEKRMIAFFTKLSPLIVEIIQRKSAEFNELGVLIKKLEKVDIPQKEQELHEASRQEAPMKPALKAAQAPRLDVSALQRELNSYVKRYRETLQVLQKMFPRLGLRIDSVHNIIGLTPTARNRIEQSQHGKDILSDLEKETARAKKLMGRINSILATGGGK